MTLPLLMDLANYRVSGAAPRLLRTKAEWDEEEEDGEIGGWKIFSDKNDHTDLAYSEYLGYFVHLIMLYILTDFGFWSPLNPWFLNWLLAYAWSDIHHLHERRWYQPVKDRRQHPIVKIVKIRHDSPGHYQKPSWGNREKCVNKQLSGSGVIIIIWVVMTQA